MEVLTILGMILLVAGFVLAAVELTMPGFGIPGISAIVCLIAGILFIADTFEEGILIMVVVIVVLGILLTIIMGLLTKRKIKSPIILDTDVKAEDSYLNSSDLEYLVHREGVAVTDLRPAGRGNFDGIDLDISSDGSYIERGTPVVIDRVSEKRLIVKRLSKEKV